MPDNVAKLSDKKKDKFEGCCWCGAEPDHKGFFNCPRVKVAMMDADGAYSVEFWEGWHDHVDKG